MKEAAGAISYSEINAMVRLGQRMELDAFLRQFTVELGGLAREDLETAKARLISLVSSLVNSSLEIGAPPSVERHIADAASEATHSETAEDLLAVAERYLAHITICAKPSANRFAIQVVERAKDIVSKKFSTNLSDEDIAKEICLSRSHFRHLFREIVGMPFMRYVTEYRLNVARRLLEESTLSVKEVACEVGYADSSSFYRAYRAYHGVAPTAHRTASV